MRKLLSLAVLSSALVFSACDKKDDVVLAPDYSRTVPNQDFILTSAQVVPAGASTSAALGSIQGTYDRRSKIFSYVLRWSNLVGITSSTGIHIHGPAERGYIAPPSPLGPFANGIVQTVPVTINTGNNKNGSYSGQLFVDGIVVKEHELLSGKYYVDIHTNASATTTQAGEIRAQIVFPVTQ